MVLYHCDEGEKALLLGKKERIMEFKFNDGGRSKYFKGFTGDCVTRAIAIATGLDYKKVYDDLNEMAKHEKGKHKKSNSRTGVYKYTYRNN